MAFVTPQRGGLVARVAALCGLGVLACASRVGKDDLLGGVGVVKCVSSQSLGPPLGLGGAQIHPGAHVVQLRVELGAWAALIPVLLFPLGWPLMAPLPPAVRGEVGALCSGLGAGELHQ